MISVIEKFHSLQGEGYNLGKPSIFLRTGGCTLKCTYCDSKHASRNLVPPKFKLVTEADIEAFANLICTAPPDEVPATNMIITGGEPLMKHQLEDISLFCKNVIGKYGIDIAFETTMITSKNDMSVGNVVDTIDRVRKILDNYTNVNVWDKMTFVISPKLDSNCYPDNPTIQEIIDYYAPDNEEDLSVLRCCHKVYYKIVYYPEIAQYILDFVNVWEKNNVDVRDFLHIMPFTPIEDKFTEEDYKKSCLATVDFCKKNNLTYSPRVHVDLYGLKLGV